MGAIGERLARVIGEISDAATRCGRDPAEVALLAVGKGHPVTALAEAADAGQRRFGENRVPEALQKIEALRGRGLEWHFIGPVQSNKSRQVAEHFDWVLSVDREKIARRLSEQRPADMPPLNVCIQVNISDEPQKSGVAPGEVEALAAAVSQLPGLRLRGLMALPAQTDDPAEQHAAFAKLARAARALREHGYDIDTLSMGMTADIGPAVAEGSTLVRVGTGIFGPRDYPAAANG